MTAIRGTGDSIKSKFGPLRVQLRKTLSATTAVLQGTERLPGRCRYEWAHWGFCWRIEGYEANCGALGNCGLGYKPPELGVGLSLLHYK